MQLYEKSKPTESQDTVMSRFLTSEDMVLSTDKEWEFVNVFKSDSCAFSHCKQGIFGHMELNAYLISETFVQTQKKGTTAGQINAVSHNIGIEFGRSLLKSSEYRSLYFGDGFLYAMAYFLIRYRNFHGEGSHHVGTVHNKIGWWILQIGQGRANIHFDTLGGAFADSYVVYAAHVLLDVVGEVVACYLDALVAHDTTKRNQRRFQWFRRLCPQSSLPSGARTSIPIPKAAAIGS